MTWETFNYSSITFRDGWEIRCHSDAVFNNFSVTIDDYGSITITGTPVSTSSTNGFAFSLYTGRIYKYGQYYTIYCNKSNMVNCSINVITNGSYNTVYQDNEDPNRSIHILQNMNVVSTTPHTLFQILIPLDKINQQFSVTLSNLCVYEGQFYNPPIKPSLDSVLATPSPAYVFQLSDSRRQIAYNFRVLTSDFLGHWARMCPLTFGVTHNGGDILLVKGYTPLHDASMILEYHVNNVTNTDGTAHGYLRIKSLMKRATYNGSATWPDFISKFRLAKRSTNDKVIWLECLVGSNSANVLKSAFNLFLFNSRMSVTNSYYPYYGGSDEVYSNAIERSYINDYIYQIADNDTIVTGTGEVTVPNTNGFV